MRIEQKPTFKRAYKKLHRNQKKQTNQAINDIINNPSLGREKKGDLSGVFVYKYDCVNQQYLLAYEWGEEWRLLLAVGPHENFYRSLNLNL